MPVGITDFPDIFGTKLVLHFSLFVFTVGIDEEDVIPQVCIFFINDDDGSRNPGSVEQRGGQPDNCFQVSSPDQPLPEFSFIPSAEKNAMRHYHGHFPGIVQGGHHVLHKHEIGFPFSGHPVIEPFLEFHPIPGVILGERGIGNHDVEGLHFSVLKMQRGHQGIAIHDIGVKDIVEEHVHLAKAPGGSVFLLPV